MHLDLERESTPGDTTAPRTGRTSNAAEGATALSLARLFFMRGFVILPLSRCSLFLSVSPSFIDASGFGFYFWVRDIHAGCS